MLAPLVITIAAAIVAGGTGNGSLYIMAGYSGSHATITRYPVASDGTLGPSRVIVRKKASYVRYPLVVDGRGSLVLTGTFEQYWTTSLQVRRADTGRKLRSIGPDRWCGGEGGRYNDCALLTGTRLARTTDLGMGIKKAFVRVSSLQTGATSTSFGPYRGLVSMLPEASADHVMLMRQDKPGALRSSGTVWRLDVTNGKTRKVGDYPRDWSAYCASSANAVLGFRYVQDRLRAKVVGLGDTPAITLTGDDSPMGCSADGRFLYVEASRGKTTQVDVIGLADGARNRVLEVPNRRLVGIGVTR